jgi:Skp family chaperone for outer membrane proteins
VDTKKTIVGVLLIAVVWFAGYRSSWADSEQAKAGSKFGVVSVRRIFQECKRNVTYREEATAEQDSLIAELDKLQKEVELGQAGLKTLKAGTTEHLNLMKETLEKQANLQAQQEFAKQQLSLKDQRWTEELYKDILAMTGEVAAAKGLDFVMESDDIELPAASANDLMLTIRTHKLLYSGGCADITAEVMAKVDSMAVSK